MFKLKPQGQQLALAARKTSKECPGAESSNEQSFGSLGAGILTHPGGKYPKGTFFHRTDEGPSGRELPEGDWLCEIKFDGYRALAFKDGKDVRLVSRNKKAFYPQLVNSLKLLPAKRVVLDGEIAGFLEAGSAFATDQRLTIIQGKSSASPAQSNFAKASPRSTSCRQIRSKAGFSTGRVMVGYV